VDTSRPIALVGRLLRRWRVLARYERRRHLRVLLIRQILNETRDPRILADIGLLDDQGRWRRNWAPSGPDVRYVPTRSGGYS
jgi:hypothetical protein